MRKAASVGSRKMDQYLRMFFCISVYLHIGFVELSGCLRVL